MLRWDAHDDNHSCPQTVPPPRYTPSPVDRTDNHDRLAVQTTITTLLQTTTTTFYSSSGHNALCEASGSGPRRVEKALPPLPTAADDEPARSPPQGLNFMTPSVTSLDPRGRMSGPSASKSATMALAQASLNIGSSAASPFHTQSALWKSASNPSLPLSPNITFPTGANADSLGPYGRTQSSKARKSIFARSSFWNLTLSRKSIDTNLREAAPHSLSTRSSVSDGTLDLDETVGPQFVSEDPFMAFVPQQAGPQRSQSIPSLVPPSPLIVPSISPYPPVGGSGFFNSDAVGSTRTQSTVEDHIGDLSVNSVNNNNSLHDPLVSSTVLSNSGSNSDTTGAKVAIEECRTPVSQAAYLTSGIVARRSKSSDDQPRQSTELVTRDRSSVSLDILDRGRTSSPTPQPPFLLVSTLDPDRADTPIAVAHEGEHSAPPVSPNEGPIPRRCASTPRLSAVFESARLRSMSVLHPPTHKVTALSGIAPRDALNGSPLYVSGGRSSDEPTLLRPPIQSRRPSLIRRLSSSLLASSSSTSLSPMQHSSRPEAGRSSSSIDHSSTPSPVRAPMPSPIEDRETPDVYLDRLVATVSKAEIVPILASRKEPFYIKSLQLYLSRFDFRSDPLDVALRKFLMDAGLPRETQQIDRVIEAFAARYESCNPGLFTNTDHAYILSFSLIMLHTDAFNPSNKSRMTKAAYVKNTRLPGVATEVLECFYENIIYAPFTFVEDDLDITGQFGYLTGVPAYARNHSSSLVSGVKPGANSSTSSLRGRLDPYVLISERSFDQLRVDVASWIPSVTPFHLEGVDRKLPISEKIRRFQSAPRLEVLEPIRRRSFPLLPSSTSQPQFLQSHQRFGMTKLGTITRKDVMDSRRRPLNRKWKEWRVILTGSQLLFFKDLSLLSGVTERDVHEDPVLVHMKPDEVISLHDAIALFDHTYNMDNMTFRFVLASGRQFVMKTESLNESLEWMCLINFASAFKSSGLRMQFTSDYITLDQQAAFPANQHVDHDGVSILPSGGVRPHKDVLASRPSHEDATSDRTSSMILPAPGDPSTHRPASDSVILRHRADIIHVKLEDLNRRISTARTGLEAELRFIRNLGILTPFTRATREKIQNVIISQAKRVHQLRLELARLRAYQRVLQDDLGHSESLLSSASMSHRVDDNAKFPREIVPPPKPEYENAILGDRAVSLSVWGISKRPEPSSGSLELVDEKTKPFPHEVASIPSSPVRQTDLRSPP